MLWKQPGCTGGIASVTPSAAAATTATTSGTDAPTTTAVLPTATVIAANTATAASSSINNSSNSSSSSSIESPRSKARILCLHGFRQNASSFSGRTRALQRKLKSVAEFVFIDAPHALAHMVTSSGAFPDEPSTEASPSATAAAATPPSGNQLAGAPSPSSAPTCIDSPARPPFSRHVKDPLPSGNQLESKTGSPSPSPSPAPACADSPARPPRTRFAWLNAGSPQSPSSSSPTPSGNQLESTASCSDSAARPPRTRFAWLIGPIDLALQASSLQVHSLQEPALQATSFQAPYHQAPSAATVPSSQYSPPHPTTTSPLHSHQHQIPHAASTTCHAGNVPAGSPDEAPGVMIASSVADSLPACTAAPRRQPVGRFPPDQLDGQVYGWATSLSHLRKVVSELGPFDGVLGFSQGAAVAAAVAALASKEREEAHALFSWKEVTVVGGKREKREEGSEKEECPRRQGAVREQKVWGGIRFAILCSGYVAAKDAHPFMHELMENSEVVKLSSLHIFGASTNHSSAADDTSGTIPKFQGNDRQVVQRRSEELASLFDADSRTVLRHACGHIIPVDTATISLIKEFILILSN
ncbi:unnamed protein product [Closterium sp. NIES-53]